MIRPKILEGPECFVPEILTEIWTSTKALKNLEEYSTSGIYYVNGKKHGFRGSVKAGEEGNLVMEAFEEGLPQLIRGKIFPGKDTIMNLVQVFPPAESPYLWFYLIRQEEENFVPVDKFTGRYVGYSWKSPDYELLIDHIVKKQVAKDHILKNSIWLDLVRIK